MEKQINLSTIGAIFQRARSNRANISTEKLADALNIPHEDITAFEQGQESLSDDTLELIFGAGIIMVIMALETGSDVSDLA